MWFGGKGSKRNTHTAVFSGNFKCVLSVCYVFVYNFICIFSHIKKPLRHLAIMNDCHKMENCICTRSHARPKEMAANPRWRWIDFERCILELAASIRCEWRMEEEKCVPAREESTQHQETNNWSPSTCSGARCFHSRAIVCYLAKRMRLVFNYTAAISTCQKSNEIARFRAIFRTYSVCCVSFHCFCICTPGT